jgi:hypothetical protein
LVSVAGQQCLAQQSDVRPSAIPRVQEVKRRALEQRLDNLLVDYQAATEQLAYTLSAVDQNKLKRQIEMLERNLEQVESKLDALE